MSLNVDIRTKMLANITGEALNVGMTVELEGSLLNYKIDPVRTDIPIDVIDNQLRAFLKNVSEAVQMESAVYTFPISKDDILDRFYSTGIYGEMIVGIYRLLSGAIDTYDGCRLFTVPPIISKKIPEKEPERGDDDLAKMTNAESACFNHLHKAMKLYMDLPYQNPIIDNIRDRDWFMQDVSKLMILIVQRVQKRSIEAENEESDFMLDANLIRDEE